MAIRISGTTGIDMGNTSVSNASQVEVQEAQVSPFSGLKNYIINGNFDIWQRGNSQTTAGYGSDDRWSNENNISTKTHSLVACTDTERALFNASKFSRTVVSSVAGAGNYVAKSQAIEDVTKLAGKTLTISFWAKADSAKNIALELQQSFGNGGNPSVIVYGISSQLMSLTTIWQKKYITVTIPSIVGKTLGNDGVHTTSTKLRFWFESGSDYNYRTASLGQQSGTFDIAQVQLEEGSVATPFEQRPYGLELSLCQRYYETINNLTMHSPYTSPSTSSEMISNWDFKVSKRAYPSITTTVAMTNVLGDLHGLRCQLVTTPGVNLATFFNATASAEL